MTGSATNFLLDGTAAIKPAVTAHRSEPRIIVIRNNGKQSAGSSQAHATVGQRIAQLIWHCLNTSEMFCSLKLEDARGVAYGLFTRKNIGAIALVSFIVAALSIAYGA